MIQLVLNLVDRVNESTTAFGSFCISVITEFTYC